MTDAGSARLWIKLPKQHLTIFVNEKVPFVSQIFVIVNKCLLEEQSPEPFSKDVVLSLKPHMYTYCSNVEIKITCAFICFHIAFAVNVFIACNLIPMPCNLFLFLLRIKYQEYAPWHKKWIVRHRLNRITWYSGTLFISKSARLNISHVISMTKGHVHFHHKFDHIPEKLST